MAASIEFRIAAELSVNPRQVVAAVGLLDDGATVPFIARYRKEATGGLDDTQLRTLEERLGYLRELEERRAAILASIQEQNKLTPELRASIEAAQTKQRLEDLYLPYKPKRRTKAQIAREAGLDELAAALLADHRLDPQTEAQRYLKPAFKTEQGDDNPGVPDVKSALDGARAILVEQFAEDAELLAGLRTHLQDHGVLVSAVIEGKEDAAAKFRDYFAYSEPLKNVPSHRALALFRGRKEELLRVSLKLPQDPEASVMPAPQSVNDAMNGCELKIAARHSIGERGQAADAWLLQTVRWAWQVKLSWQLEAELLTQLRERAEEEAIRVFARNLHDLLLAAPAGPRATMGLDPGLRTGVKVAVVDRTGKLLDTATVYPHVPRNEWDRTIAALALLARKHGVDLISIGNGTASRETDKLVAELIRKHPELKLTKIVVSEAGASVYSASALASKEFPQLDVSLRGAVSIARRLQDPLAELVKIEPKAIGVGQYQHDVSQTKLARSLDAVVEDCVNAVGVDVNTASAALLARISGLSATLAENIVKYRDEHGAFPSRAALKKVPRLGEKTFEQAAGFLRIMNAADPLDASAVHPEAYPVVQRILADLKRPAREILGDGPTLRKLDPAKYTDERFGLPTVRDILRELEKPGRDPRPEFRTAEFKEGVEELKDLQAGMILEGTVTNVTNFGAFVDIGVHQDGLVHISMMSNTFVKDPHEVVRAGEVVKVKVLEVDEKRRRIALSMRLDEAAPRPRAGAGADGRRELDSRPAKPFKRPPEPQGGGAMADALARALKRS
ncbi:transcription accessory protein [Steroidobacter denitrificans]|uniref:Transcription accessory protein n=1 Tax=Steroidobacter denitrificans TaxID=465721 RepID=A0A127F828_STEDE|nr:Tex family protein [Steroidobacter denitrificans]AMN46557.1 transcription accessory protein [Steroidobacter denitrificans]